jgi:hypothetical protein
MRKGRIAFAVCFRCRYWWWILALGAAFSGLLPEVVRVVGRNAEVCAAFQAATFSPGYSFAPPTPTAAVWRLGRRLQSPEARSCRGKGRGRPGAAFCAAVAARKKTGDSLEHGGEEDAGVSDALLDYIDQEPVLSTQRKGRKRKKDRANHDGEGGGEPMHWTLDADAPLIVRSNSSMANAEDGEVSLVRFIVRGQPRPLVRHRVSTFRMYNPSAAAQASFRKAVRELLRSHNVPNGKLLLEDDDDHEVDSSNAVMFPTQSLAVSVAFRMRRPLNHFEASKRTTHPPAESPDMASSGDNGIDNGRRGAEGRPRLRRSAPSQTFVTRSDVDNLAKFVLDSLNGLLYEDDRQVCSLHATRMLDNDGLCLGSTEVCVRAVDDACLPRILQGSFGLF